MNRNTLYELDYIEKPRITLAGSLIVLFCWGMYAVIYSLAVTAAGQGPFPGVLLGQLVGNLILLALTMPAWWFILREMDTKSWWMRILAHTLYAPLFAWVGAALFFVYARFTMPDPQATAAIKEAFPFIIVTNITAYLVYFAILHASRAILRLRYQKKRAAELLNLARESELAALKAQLNPHFLFNTLNSISALAGGDPEATRSMISQLAEMLRYAIDSSKRDMVSMQEEIDFTRAYLAIEKERMADRLTVNWNVDEHALDEFIPPIIIQPLVENAIKHGLAPRESGGAITITVYKNTETIDVSVKDDGLGAAVELDLDAANGIGLANTKKRLKNRFGSHASFSASTDPSGGFVSAFSIPY